MFVIRVIGFGIAIFFMAQGILDITGIARSIPAVGAVVAGLLGAFQYAFHEKSIVREIRNSNDQN